jgi:hypothetical protein
MKRPVRSAVAPDAEGLTRGHLRRLRQYFRSAGWPCQDNVELDLLDRGLVRRADLLGDLKRDAKRRGYQSCSQAFYYAIAEGIAEPGEIPADCGLIVAGERTLRVVRPAPHREVSLTTAQWVALVRAGAEFGDDDEPPQLAF